MVALQQNPVSLDITTIRMPEFADRLAAIAAQLKSGISPQRETVVAFLGWFGVQRRGVQVVGRIRRELDRHGIATTPDFETAFYYGTIAFTKAKSNGKESLPDPTVRLSELQAANRPPLTVAPDSLLKAAVSLMISKDYSQLPVMTGPREVKGLVSWRSIGRRLGLGLPCVHVKDCMEKPRILALDTSLFEAIEIIAKEDCALVQAHDKTVCGIVTATDVNEQFLLLAEPFLLVGEVEKGLRQMLHGKFSATQLASAKAPGDDREIADIADLSFGEYARLIQADANWNKLKLSLDKAAFCAGLERVRLIRNDVMHFSPEGIEPSDMEELREFASYMRTLREIGAL